ncbi:MAG: protein kinase [Myxococcota bacterium]
MKLEMAQTARPIRKEPRASHDARQSPAAGAETWMPDGVGPYELVSFIGRGGMGEVWLAVRRELGMACVIKVMRPELSANESYRTMFLNEARIASQLRHSRIVRVHDVGESRGLLYLVMDRVDGVNLSQFLSAHAKQKAGPLSLSLVAYIINELLEGLSYAHGRRIDRVHDAGVIHHDITPSNVLISSQGEVMLTDFGIARFAGAPTLESRPFGTLRYMAPERLTGRVTRQSDLYSVGAVLHELLARRPPLPKCSDSDELRRALLFAPTPPTGRHDVPPALEGLRVALLEKKPFLRLRSADEALEMLSRVDGSCGGGANLRALYGRVIGPASSGMTMYLQQHSSSQLPSFLAPMLEAWRGESPTEQPAAPARGAAALMLRTQETVDVNPSTIDPATRRWAPEASTIQVGPVALDSTGGEPEAPTRRHRPVRADTPGPGTAVHPRIHRQVRIQRAATRDRQTAPPNANARTVARPRPRPAPVDPTPAPSMAIVPDRAPSGGAPSVPMPAAATVPTELARAAADVGRSRGHQRLRQGSWTGAAMGALAFVGLVAVLAWLISTNLRREAHSATGGSIVVEKHDPAIGAAAGEIAR